MCKTRRDRAVSFEKSRKSPLPRSSSSKSESSPTLPIATDKEVKEWEDARCPVCMEHPHNAVLLICSSYNKGCRPYMCDTSQRHSNCLEQFRKSFAKPSFPSPLEEGPPHAQWSDTLTGQTLATDLSEVGESQAPNNLSHMHKLNQELACPLCRGQISGWTVVQSAREFMNTKTRSCACETCDFTGNYRDLRKHARVEHPDVRPTDPDPERENNWRQLERQRDIEDVISNLRSLREDDENGTENSSFTMFLVFQVAGVRVQTELIASEGESSVFGRRRIPVRRRAVSYGEEVGSISSVEDDNEALELDGHQAHHALTSGWGRAGDLRVRRRQA